MIRERKGGEARIARSSEEKGVKGEESRAFSRQGGRPPVFYDAKGGRSLIKKVDGLARFSSVKGTPSTLLNERECVSGGGRSGRAYSVRGGSCEPVPL